MLNNLHIKINFMRALTKTHRVWIVVTTFLTVLFSILSCFQARTISCNSPFDDRGCPNGMFFDEGGSPLLACVHKYYNPCEKFSDCPYYGGERVFLSPNETLARCPDERNRGEERCFCAGTIRYWSPRECEVNTVAIGTSFDEEKYCVPCSLLSSPNETSAHNICLSKYSYENRQQGRNCSFF